jgi:ubiquinone/menaquinone biosynthesis C-methylase UbiE
VERSINPILLVMSVNTNTFNVPTLQEFERELVKLSEQYSLLHCRSLISVQQYRPAYQLFRKYVPAGARVLDWGAGNGHFSYFLMRSGYKTFGFSFDDMPAVGSALGPGTYEYRRGSDAVRLPFEDHSFDAVSSIGVLEHVRETGGDETASLREIRRVLRPGGVFICVHFPNKYSWIEFLARRLDRSSHRFKYAQEDILRLTGGAGLKVIEMARYGALPRNVWSGDSLKKIGSWPALVGTYGLADGILSTTFRCVCQNYWFVAGHNELA